MAEDDIYRSSTQYRLWSFSRSALHELRERTNHLAAARVRAAFPPSAPVPDCLTPSEELALVTYYCKQCLSLGSFLDFPTGVVATATQYLKRFYLTNSPMTYHPKALLPTALFLATKTENHHVPLRDFARRLPRTEPDDVLAPEFLLTQGLRFAFDVRHPHRGLKGAYLELRALADGKGVAPPRSARAGASPADLQREMRRLPPRSTKGEAAATATALADTDKDRDAAPPAALQQRLQDAYGRANESLRGPALLSDAYFHFSPAQIWLGALWAADEPLARFYVATKLPAASGAAPTRQDGGGGGAPLASTKRLVPALQACADMLAAHSDDGAGPSSSSSSSATAAAAAPGARSKDDLVRIDKKLYQCRNPDKLDLVGLNRAQKRDQAGLDGRLDENVAKRRRVEREKGEKEAEEVFGGALKGVGNGGGGEDAGGGEGTTEAEKKEMAA
ncbi:cyclin-like protein [Lineolata rhizophorae]|uniref:Cyclin-like protein n=1 Tax=Lineolata rhizophorae TaxID=578093 RepID=A0A6A6P048_9PEZI|nr:cyclin-like protein [Lineolata rhizophorae]